MKHTHSKSILTLGQCRTFREPYCNIPQGAKGGGAEVEVVVMTKTGPEFLAYTTKANARRLALCWNEHDELKEALKESLGRENAAADQPESIQDNRTFTPCGCYSGNVCGYCAAHTLLDRLETDHD